MNEIDRQILSILQEDARVTNVEMARRVGLAPSAVLERVRKLEARGLVRGYEARLDAAALGQGLLAFMFVQSDERVGSGETGAALSAVPGVQEVHHVAGEDCYLVKVRVADAAELGRLLRDRIGTIPSVRSTRTTIVLETVKETTAVRLEGELDEGGEG
jgi:Lrp/AsnC family transcriptional regulator, leucine-responsive regulatory protein